MLAGGLPWGLTLLAKSRVVGLSLSMPRTENLGSVTQVSVDVNLGGMLGHLQLLVQRTMNLVSLGLQAGRTLPTQHVELPDTSIAFSIDRSLRWEPETAKAEFTNWLLVNGFRDASEAVAAFLESIRTVVAFWHLATSQSQKGKLRGTDWNERVVDESKKFHRLGLRQKFQFLQKEYGLSLDPVLVEQVLTINAVRNCLVHRGGIVGPIDVDNEGKLVVKWTRLAIIIRDSTGEREAVPPAKVEAGGEVSIQNMQTEKAFSLGRRITFGVQEFSDLCWTLFLFGSSTTQVVEKYGRARGIQFKNPPDRLN